MPDQIIDATMARSLNADACRDHPLVAWPVMKDPAEYPDKFTARLVTEAPTPYVLLADTLAALQAELPPGLVRGEWQPGDPPDLVEIWFAK